MEHIHRLFSRPGVQSNVAVSKVIHGRAVSLDDLTCFGFSTERQFQEVLDNLDSNLVFYGRGDASMEQWLRSIWQQVLDNGLSVSHVLAVARTRKFLLENPNAR
jgi:hypothetical protein